MTRLADSAPGETDLARLLASLDPVLQPGVYGYDRLADGAPVPPDAVMMMNEPGQGRCVIRPWFDQRPDEGADQHRTMVFPCRMISLRVASSLEAVGMMAAIAQRLTAHDISCNVVAGLQHDHLFVPPHQAELAVAVLTQLQQEQPKSA